MPSSHPPPPQTLTISSRIVCRIVDAASARGVDPDALYRDAEIDPEDARDVDARIPVLRYLALWGLASARVDDPAFPLHVAATWAQTHNLLRFVCMTSANLGEALTLASRYLRVITNAVSWPLEHRGTTSVLAMDRAESRLPETRLAEMFAVAELITLARAFTGIPGLAFPAVRFAFARPEEAELVAIREFLGAPVSFDAARTEIEISAELLGLPLVKADPAQFAFFESYVQKLLRSEPAASNFVDDVKAVLADSLRGIAPSLDEVAARLDLSGRTLRRRLSSVGCTFQGVLDEMRESLSKQHIERGQLSLAEISFLLGFSEPSAFHRAFRRWTGMTPQAYARSRHAPQTPSARLD